MMSHEPRITGTGCVTIHSYSRRHALLSTVAGMKGLFRQRWRSIAPQINHTKTGNKSSRPIQGGKKNASNVKAQLQPQLTLSFELDPEVVNRLIDI
jgi:hypothetical protein